MHTNNPFGRRPPSCLVDRLIGKSYEVVKTVYLNLPLFEELHDSEVFTFMFENWEQVEKIISNEQAIKNISENLDIVLDIPNWIDKIEQTRDDSLEELSKALAEHTATLQDQLDNALIEIAREADTAMYSYRYIDIEPVALENVSISHIYPQSNLKTGDHLVTPTGDIVEVVFVNDAVLQVGRVITSIRGPQGLEGLPGTGLSLQGVYDSLEDFNNANLQGKPGDAYQIYNPETGEHSVYIWNPNTNTWKDAGPIQGTPGLSANEILMDPDPERYFVQIYGQSSGDILGDIVMVPEFKPDPTDTYESVLNS